MGASNAGCKWKLRFSTNISLYHRNDTKQGHSYCRKPTETRMRSSYRMVPFSITLSDDTKRRVAYRRQLRLLFERSLYSRPAPGCNRHCNPHDTTAAQLIRSEDALRNVTTESFYSVSDYRVQFSWGIALRDWQRNDVRWIAVRLQAAMRTPPSPWRSCAPFHSRYMITCPNSASWIHFF